MPLTILVAEDDLGSRLVIGDYLKMLGYSVILAENGQEALDLVESYQPHLIITDIAMPIMDGYDFVRQVRSRPFFRLLPVIFLTALHSTEERIKGYQLGCDNYLPKPFEPEELGIIVRSLLERYALIAQQGNQRGMALDDNPHGTHHSPTLNSAQGAEQINTNQVDHNIILSKREQDVLKLLMSGLSNAEIADRIYLSPRTVEKYVASLLRKTDSKNRAELVRFTMEKHLISF